MSITVDELLHELDQTGMLSSLEIGRLKEHLAVDTVSTPPDRITQDLVRRGKLTNYQAAAFNQGKSKSLVFGDYVVLDKLGRGGVATVFRARHRVSGEIIALKVLSPKAGKTADTLQRFQREAAAATAIRHPHVVAALAAGGPDEHNGAHYIVMEYVEGRDLEKVIQEDGPLPVRTAVMYIAQAAEALAHAHTLGIVHRDIKPSNLLVDPRGIVKILDLGLARIDDALSVGTEAGAMQGLTQTGRIMGTVDYMSPEQALDTKKVDRRADIYSLGCTLFYLLIGKTVYAGDTIMKKLLAHRQSPIPSLLDLRGDVPDEVDAVFRKMVAKNRNHRYAKMEEVVAALDIEFGGLRAGRSDAAAPSPSGDTDSVLETGITSMELAAAPLPGPSRPARHKRPRRTFKPPGMEWLQGLERHSGALVRGACGVAAVLGLILIASAFWPKGQQEAAPQGEVAPAPEDQRVMQEELLVGPQADFATISEAIAFARERYDRAAHAWRRQIVKVRGGDTYSERIVVDAGQSPLPIPLSIICDDAEPAVIASPESGPLVALTDVAGFRLQGFVLDAAGRDVAVDIAGPRDGVQLADLSIRKFAKFGVKMTGVARGDVRLERVAFQSSHAAAVAVTIAGDAAARPNLFVERCRFVGPLNGGVSVSAGLGRCEFRANLCDRQESALSVAAASPGESLVVVNNTFHACARGVKATEAFLAGCKSVDIRRNLFAQLTGAEVEYVGGTAAAAGEWLDKHAAGSIRNWTTRSANSPRAPGELDVFSGNGRRGVPIDFVSRDPGSQDFLVPRTKPAETLPDDPRLKLLPFIGAVEPAPDAAPIASPYLLRTLAGHDAPITAVVCTCDGSEAAIADAGGTIRLFNLHSGTRLHELTHAGGGVCLAVSPDGRFLLSGGRDKSVRLWDLQSGQPVRTLAELPQVPTALAWSPDGRTAAIGSEDGALRIWSIEPSAEVRMISAHSGRVHSLAYSLTGQFVLSAGADGGAALWDLNTGREIWRLAHPAAVTAARFTATGLAVVTAALDARVRLWDAVTGQFTRATTEPAGPLLDVAVAPDGGYAFAAHQDGTLDVVNLSTGESVQQFREHQDAVTAVATGGGTLLVSGGRDAAVRVWNASDWISAAVSSCRLLPASDVVNSVGMRFAYVPAGEFQMGSPETEAERIPNEQQHTVRITRPFYLGAFEVTQAHFEAVMQQNPSSHRPVDANAGNLPVENVSWPDAAAFCEKLSTLPAERTAGRTYRLPTEAEWELACRAGTGGPFGFGEALSSKLANFNGFQPYGTTDVGPDHGKPVVVGSYRPNLLGLYDMHGNVHEWCADLFEQDFYQHSPAEDPLPVDNETTRRENPLRAYRGGSWNSRGIHCRSAVRGRQPGVRGAATIGFRVVCETGLGG